MVKIFLSLSTTVWMWLQGSQSSPTGNRQSQRGCFRPAVSVSLFTDSTGALPSCHLVAPSPEVRWEIRGHKWTKHSAVLVIRAWLRTEEHTHQKRGVLLCPAMQSCTASFQNQPFPPALGYAAQSLPFLSPSPGSLGHLQPSSSLTSNREGLSGTWSGGFHRGFI